MPRRIEPHSATTLLPWVGHMRWHDLLFMHWPIRPTVLRSLIPAGLDLETFDGDAWLGVVPFRMTDVRPRFMPPLPGLSAFPELNVRTYVTRGGRPGVWFFSLDATNPIAVRVARWAFHLPYFDAQMSCTPAGDDIQYNSIRTHPRAPAATFTARYGPTAPVYHSKPGDLDHWLTDRLCLYSASRRGDVFRCDIHHGRWPLQPAHAEVERNTMTQWLRVPVPDTPPLLHFARRLDVATWFLRRAKE